MKNLKNLKKCKDLKNVKTNFKISYIKAIK